MQQSEDKINILLVDDKVDNLTVLEAVLQNNNYNLFHAQSGPEAIAKAAEREMAVILLDVQMPGMDGFQTAEEIRKRGVSYNSPIIFVTAIYGDETYVHQGYDLGAVDYIFKPFSPHILKSKVNVFADLFRKNRQLIRQGELLKAREVAEVRVEAFQQRQAEKKRYLDLVEHLDHCIIWSARPDDLSFTFVSTHAEKLTGYPLREWRKNNLFWIKSVPSEDIDGVLKCFKEAQKGGERSIEHRFITKSGELRWFHTAVRIVKQGPELSPELLGLSVDITSNKNSEEKLQETQAQLASIVGAAPIIIFATDKNGVVTLCDGKDAQNLVLDPQVFVGKSIFEMTQNTELKKYVSDALSGKQFTAEIHYQERWFNVSFSPRANKRGEITGVIGVAQNITEQKTYQLNLEESERAQRFLADANASLAASLDYEVNLRNLAEKITSDFASKCIIHITDEDSDLKKLLELGSHQIEWENEPIAESIKKVFESGKVEYHPQYIGAPMTSRGNINGVLTIISSERNYSVKDRALFEELARRAGAAVDNSRLYKNAEKAIHTRDEFLSIASHELKTPLTPLKLQFQTIRKLIQDDKIHTLSPEKLTKMLNRSDRQLDRITNLIEDLLSVSRINLGRVNLEFTATNLKKVVLDVVEQFRDQLNEAKCEIDLNLEDVTGQWDPFRVEQVVVNLLTNALKYGNGYPIYVQLREEREMAILLVRDHGIGIAPCDQKRIFDLFERAAPAQNYGGLGLGLYIVRNIVREHHGEVRVVSEEGKGSSFVVELPLHSAQVRPVEISVHDPQLDMGMKSLVEKAQSFLH